MQISLSGLNLGPKKRSYRQSSEKISFQLLIIRKEKIMKNKVLSLAIASIFTFGTTTFAQTAQTAPDSTKKECCKMKKERCGNKKNAKCSKPRNPFEALTLSEQQRAALAAIPTPEQALKAARETKAQADTATVKREKARELMRNARENYLAQVKAVLSSEQYVQFLENYYAESPAKMNGKKFADKKDRKNRKCKKDRGNKGPRADRNGKSAETPAGAN